MSTQKQHVMVIPAPAQGHVKPLMLFSHNLAKHGFRITFVNTEFNHKRILSTMNEESRTGLGSLIELVSIPDGLGPEDHGSNLVQLCSFMQDTLPGEIEKLIGTINGGHMNDKISCVVSDIYIGWTMEVAAKMGVKGALFCPSSAAFIVYIMNIPKMIHDGIIDSEGSQFWTEDSSCLPWLDQHKPCSVIYVAFGSSTVHEQAQFQELALGLKFTGRPFLWVVRPGFIFNEQNGEFNLDEFLGHNNNHLGKIVSWAPQQKVLGHPSIACFVTHCGWNSTMEGLSNGVPFLCWPYFADQFLNKSYICEVWKVGMGFECNENGIISSGEVKNKVDKLLGDGDIKKRSLELKEMGMKNITKDGQSSNNFINFIKWLEEA